MRPDFKTMIPCCWISLCLVLINYRDYVRYEARGWPIDPTSITDHYMGCWVLSEIKDFEGYEQVKFNVPEYEIIQPTKKQ